MYPSISARALTITSAVLCIIACMSDLVLISVFGSRIPGYNQLTNTLSSLGDSDSPVATLVTVWSLVLGIIFVFFAFGFRQAFISLGGKTKKAFWLIILYGLGENIASGIFRADRINGKLTDMALLHDFLGGVGVVALLLLPFVMQKIFSRFSFPLFSRLSGLTGLVGIISTALFSFRIHYFENTFLHTYCGLWQRIFLVNFYLYFVVIAIKMLKEAKHTRTIIHS